MRKKILLSFQVFTKKNKFQKNSTIQISVKSPKEIKIILKC